VIQGAGQGEHFQVMELRCCIRNAELKGKAEDHIVQHVYFGHAATGHFLQDDAALPPLDLVEELSFLVVYDFQRCKGDAQWGMGTLV